MKNDFWMCSDFWSLFFASLHLWVGTVRKPSILCLLVCFGGLSWPEGHGRCDYNGVCSNRLLMPNLHKDVRTH